LAGALLLAMGAFKLGALVRYIPVTIVIGFTNGIAVLIGLSQVKDLLGLDIPKMPADFFSQLAALTAHARSVNPAAVGIGLASLAVVVLWPKTYAAALLPAGPGLRVRHLVSRLPGTIVALVAATLATAFLNLPVDTIGSRFGGIPQSLPQLALPPFSWEGAQQLFIPTITIAFLAAIESLLCARVADNLCPDQKRHDPNQELMAQGIANMLVPLVGGLPATGTIARTVTNVRSGATSPVAGMVHAATLLAVVLVAAPLAEHVPLAALAGILLFVAWNMGEWREFARLRQFSPSYRLVLLGTFFLTVVFDLTVAMEVGLLLSCATFIYRMGTLFRVERDLGVNLPEGVQVVHLYGALFFGATPKLDALAEAVAPGTRAVVLELHRLVSIDNTGLDGLEQLHRSLARQGVALVLCDLNDQPASLVRRSGFDQLLGPTRLFATLHEALAHWSSPPLNGGAAARI
jgi:SulP family sulfate permease